ncbi:MAG: Ig-like domain-containing protein [Novosphingobium sp.]|nr:Ig-like domain-containing protein [Novosphingobium sp.]
MASPTAEEQYLLELLNEARLDPLASAARYISSYAPLTSSDVDIQFALKYFGVSGSALESAFSLLTPTGPLAWNDALGTAADKHSAAMINAQKQSHQVPGEAGLGARITAEGYVFTAAGENVYAYVEDPLFSFAGFMVDWGNGPDGMQAPAGHRNNIMNAGYREVGIDYTEEGRPGTSLGPYVVTQDFGARSGKYFVLGAAYTDRDNDDFYSIGEGRADLTVTIGNASITTGSAGGYSLEAGTGAKTILLSGGGLSGNVTVTAAIRNENIKLDVVDGTILLSSASISATGAFSELRALGARGVSLVTGEGSQILVGNKGDDTLDGGAGIDIVRYDGASTLYRVTANTDGSLTVTGNGAGTDTLVNIEIIRFADGDFHWDSAKGSLASGTGGTTVATPTNNAPIAASSKTMPGTEDKAKKVVIVAEDPDGDELTYTASKPENGSITGGNRGIFTYTPNKDFSGVDTFVVTIDDGRGGKAFQTVYINVLNVDNDAPVANPTQAVEAEKNTASQITVVATDPDGDKLTYTATKPAHGTVTGGENGVFTYTPTGNYTGSDSFVVTVRDGNGASVKQTVSVTVKEPVNGGGDNGGGDGGNGGDPDDEGQQTTLPDVPFRMFATDGFVGEVGGAGFVYGTNGAQTISLVNATGSLVFDSSFTRGNDALSFAGSASAYKISYADGIATLSTNGRTYDIPIGVNGMDLSFSDGIRTLIFDANAATAKIGNQAIGATQATITAPAQSAPLSGDEDTGFARLFLGKDGGAEVGGNFFIGGTAGSEHVVYRFGNLELDGSFNRGGDTLELPEAPGSFRAYIDGSSLILLSDLGTIEIPVGVVGMTLDFNGDERVLKFDEGTGKFMLGSQEITATSEGDAVTVGALSGTSLDIGSQTVSAMLVLNASDNVVLTDNANRDSFVHVKNFNAGDTIHVTNAQSSDYNFRVGDGDLDGKSDDLIITYFAANSNEIVLIDVAPNGGFAMNTEAGAEQILGWNFISFG